MRGVNLNDFESGANGAIGSARERIGDAVDFGNRERVRNRIARAKRNRRRRDWQPTVRLIGRDHSAAIPRHMRAGFASRVRELHGWHRALLLDEARDFAELRHVIFAPDAEVPVRNTSAWFDGRSFGHDESRTADGARTEMDKVPVAGEAVNRGVFAHRRYGDAIGQRCAACWKGFEEH